MTVDIRPARPEDLDPLVVAVGEGEYFAHHMARPETGTLLVAREGRDPLGAAFLAHRFADPDLAERLPGTPVLDQVQVAPARRGEGIGTALIAAVEDLARSQGYGSIALLVESDNPDAKRLYERLKYEDWGNGPVGTCHMMLKLIADGVPGLDAWRAWHPRQAAEVLAGVDAPWHVAGGWALDLWHGEQTREHGDLEIAVPRAAYGPLRARLRERHTLFVAGGGQVVPLRDGEAVPADRHQVWVCEPEVPAWRMDTFLEPGTGETWVCRRDERITLPYADITAVTADGVRYLRPEAVLLFKAKGRREKDEADLARALPRLSAEALAWLRDALALAHPGHPWAAELDRFTHK